MSARRLLPSLLVLHFAATSLASTPPSLTASPVINTSTTAVSKPLGTGISGWVDVTTGPLGDAGLARGVGFADVDNDDDLDLFLLNHGPQGSKLLRNEGGEVFTVVAGGALSEDYSGTGFAFGDLDNDGDLDLYIQSSGSDRVLRNEGDGVFSRGAFAPLGGDGIGVTVGDVNGDGLLDVYVPSDDRDYDSSMLYRNLGNLAFVSTFEGDHTHAYGQGGATFGDFDSDGDQDLSGAGIYRNDNGVLVLHSSGTGAGRAAAFADWDNDGDLDLLSSTNVRFYYSRNDGAGDFVRVIDGLPDVADGPGIAFGDVDNDGDLDLFADQLYLNDGAGGFVAMPGSPTGGASAVFGDVDNDGDLDLYVARKDGNLESPNSLYRNDGLAAGNHWLHIRLIGTASNRSAIGARVRIVSAGVSQIREISASTGRYSQNSLLVEFGLGQASEVDSIVVQWPSGLVQVLTSDPGSLQAELPVDEVMTITEDSVTPALVSTIRASAEPGLASISWHIAGIGTGDATVSRREGQDAWRPVAVMEPDLEGRVDFEDEDVLPGRRYGYRVGITLNGQEVNFEEVWLDIPLPFHLAINSVRLHSNELAVAFELAETGKASLAVVDVAGRRVLERSLGHLAAGPHNSALGVRSLPAGLYFVTLRQRAEAVTRKAVVVR